MNDQKLAMLRFAIQLPILLLISLLTQLSGQGMPLQVTALADSLECHSDDNGTLRWEADGGVTPYSYEWRRLGDSFVFSGGSQVMQGQGGPIGGNLEANNYVVTIIDAAGNIALDTVEIGEPNRILITAVSVTNATCAGECNGIVDMTVEGGTGSLITSWNDSPVMGVYREDLCAGEHVFFIEDQRGCRQKGIIPIEEPTAITTEVALSSPVCAGVADGAISVSSTGGTGEFTYAWPGGTSSSEISGISGGTYELTITDEANCNEILLIDLPEGPSFQANLQTNYGCGDGRVIVSSQPINGTEPYNYEWSTGGHLPFLFQMSAGEYSLSLVDANGCLDELNFTLDYVEPLEVETAIQDASCPGVADGTATLVISGGLTPYDLRWDDNSTGLQRSNLAGGTYNYNINANGCGYAGAIQVYEPQPLYLELDFLPQSDNFLTAVAYLSGGTFPYSYQWSNGSTGMSANNLSPDLLYQLQVTDANGCTAEWDVNTSITNVSGLHDGENLKVYPNPSSGHFTVDIPYESTKQFFTITNSQGLLLKQGQAPNQNSLQLDLSELPGGVYYLTVGSAAGNLILPLIKI